MTELTLKIYAGALAFWLLFYCFIKVAELRFPPWVWTIIDWPPESPDNQYHLNK